VGRQVRPVLVMTRRMTSTGKEVYLQFVPSLAFPSSSSEPCLLTFRELTREFARDDARDDCFDCTLRDTVFPLSKARRLRSVMAVFVEEKPAARMEGAAARGREKAGLGYGSWSSVGVCALAPGKKKGLYGGEVCLSISCRRRRSRS
jgi:hypothetical protein